jgi:hypothetical protein
MEEGQQENVRTHMEKSVMQSDLRGSSQKHGKGPYRRQVRSRIYQDQDLDLTPFEFGFQRGNNKNTHKFARMDVTGMCPLSVSLL